MPDASDHLKVETPTRSRVGVFVSLERCFEDATAVPLDSASSDRHLGNGVGTEPDRYQDFIA